MNKLISLLRLQQPRVCAGGWRLLLGGLLAPLACPLPAATSLHQFGITWTFSADRVTGQYANGDHWVVGPVTIIGITPISTVVTAGRVINGSMVNPKAGMVVKQGFDSSLAGDGVYSSYDPALNRARPGGQDLSAGNPLTLPAGSSLISSVSHPVPTNRPALTDAAILTVVAAPPAAGAFRPPPQGTDKSQTWNKASLNSGILKSLAPVAGTPRLATVAGYFARPWLEISTEASGRYFHPVNNQPDYGSNMAWQLSDGLLSLHLNYPPAQKETLFIRLVQYGIDVYGAAKAGGNWAANGGHNLGRKMPLVLAGLALGDADILAYADGAKHFIFQEDQQTFVVTQSDVGRPLNHGDGRLRVEYTSADVGLPEWGERHPWAPDRDARNWDAYYRNLNYGPLMGHALAARLTTGAVAAWNWRPFHDYMDRAKSLAAPAEVGKFTHEMWQAYRPLGGSTAP